MENNSTTQAVETTQIDLKLNDLVQVLDSAVKGLKSHILPVEDTETFTKEEVLFIMKKTIENVTENASFNLSGNFDHEVEIDESFGSLYVSGSIDANIDLSDISDYDYDVDICLDSMLSNSFLLSEIMVDYKEQLEAKKQLEEQEAKRLEQERINQLQGNAYEEAQND